MLECRIFTNTGLDRLHSPKFDYTLAVVSVEVNYLKPLKLLEEFEIRIGLLSEREGRTSFQFKYEVFGGDGLCATGKTLHVGLNSKLKVVKPPKGFDLVTGDSKR